MHTNPSRSKSTAPKVAAEITRLVRGERLWVPLLTHFDEKGRVSRERNAAHVRALRPFLSGYLLAGSTGAGWAADDAQFNAIVELGYDTAAFDDKCLLLVGCLRPTTAEVIARSKTVESRYRSEPPAARFAGLTICPPVGAHSQQQVLEHFERVMDATESPIAVYQLPQVTRCEIAPETMRKLVETGRVHMFKDTSGEDRIADSGVLSDEVWMLRGAEGGYAEALAPKGRYVGWLLSSANGLAMHFRGILDATGRGDEQAASKISARLTRAVTAIFELAGKLDRGNPFSNANRAIDHVQAYGSGCLQAPMPRRVDGSALPEDFVQKVSEVLRSEELVTERGYLEK